MSTSMSETEIKEHARTIADQLNENNGRAIKQIETLIEHMGADYVQKYVKKTEQIEAKGGMKTDDGARRRTKGGVFFYIIKVAVPEDVRKIVFPRFGMRREGKVITWKDRMQYIADLVDEESAEHGEMHTLTITVKGRPGKVHVVDNSVVTTIVHTHKQLPLAHGVPQPTQVSTVYTIYMPIRKWRDVEQYLKDAASDYLIVEGSQLWDAESGTIAVLAREVSTRRRQRDIRRGVISPVPDENFDYDADDDEDEDATLLSTSASSPSQPTPPAPTEVEEEPEPEEEIPNGMSAADFAQLKKLQTAADKYRQRISDMKQQGKKRGVKMTETLLANTENQIRKLEQKYDL